MVPKSQQGKIEPLRDGYFIGGVNSMLPPALLEEGQYSWGVNIVNRGGLAQTRPGHREVLALPDGNLQGFRMFRPRDQLMQMVFAVDGLVYRLEEPFEQPEDWTWHRIPNVQFREDAMRIVFKEAVKSVQVRPNGELMIVDPYPVLMMQDGLSACAYWDGVNSRHTRSDYPWSETPMGQWMEWSGDRLWVGRGRQLFASDIADPLSFRETEYLLEGGAFLLPDEITGIHETPSPEQKTLLVFTRRTTTAFLAYIRDRNKWKATENFQNVVFPGIGCVAGKSIVTQYGLVWWMSEGGLMSSDAAAQTYRSSQIHYRDHELTRSKTNLSPLRSEVCGASFENYLLISVPSGDTRNAHTWVLDAAIADTLNSDSPAAWQGVWTGIRPIEYAEGQVGSRSRLFCASEDYGERRGSRNHIWELFDDSRTDNGNPIYCCLETRRLGGSIDLYEIVSAQVQWAEVLGHLPWRISYRGEAGGWKVIAESAFKASPGSVGGELSALIDTAEDLEAFIPQARMSRTQTVGREHAACGTCGLETDNAERLGRGFQLRIEWCGRGAVESYQIFARPETEQTEGACHTAEPEDAVHAIDSGGCRRE